MDYFSDITLPSVFIVLIIIIIHWNAAEVKRRTKIRWSKVLISLVILLLLFLLCIIFLMFLSFWIYREIIYLIIRIKHKNNDIKLLKGIDQGLTAHHPQHAFITILMIVRKQHYETDIFQKLKEILDNTLCGKGKTFSRFQCCLRTFFGYNYLITKNITAQKCVKHMPYLEHDETNITKERLMEIIEECFIEPLPNNGEALWDAFVGTRPLKNWKKDNTTNSNYYPILFRFHHVLGDGVSLSSLIYGVLADKEENRRKYSESKEDGYNGNAKYTKSTSETDNFLKQFVACCNQKIKKCLTILQTVILIPSSFFIIHGLLGNDYNILHGPPRKYSQIFAFKIDEFGSYFQKIKTIKHKLNGYSFPEIVFAAISSSLAKYIKKESGVCPEYLSAAIPVCMTAKELLNMSPGQLKSSNADFSIDFNVLTMKFSLYTANESNNMDRTMKTLKLIKEEVKNADNPSDALVGDICYKQLHGVLPNQIARIIVSIKNYTMAISCLPGTKKISIGDGALFTENLIFWIPNYDLIYVNFGIITYGNQLVIGLNADKAYIPDQLAAESILDDTFKYLDELEEAVSPVT